MEWFPIAVVITLAMGFTYTNGFHDASNAVATSISTRALTPRAALAMAAGANFIGAFFGTRVAETVGSGIIDPPSGHLGILLCAAALIGATAWSLLTWRLGMPSSATHALVGGLGGAALALGARVEWQGILTLVVIPMLVSPTIGLVLARLLMRGVYRVLGDVDPARVRRGFRALQTGSAAAMAFGHGMQDAAKTAGVIVLALTVGGFHHPNDQSIPFWVISLCALVMALGTWAGGWPLMRTLGRRIVPVTPTQGFAAETTAAIVLLAATALRAPISTTHVITAAVVGAGTTKGVRRVRWGLVRDIVRAWVLTFPGAAIAAALVAVLARLAFL
ncbi:anion permease [Janibacter sp. GXQ6167]|uniref:inorganic phosphate transporter n=1 Tax=Janibacter sp. GXQ6167 TaxID=3240791 RepID=UPI003525D215